MAIGERIKKLRKTEKLTQQAFADTLGVGSGYISMLEKGQREPSEQLIFNICRAFNVSDVWLKNGVGEMYETTVKWTPKGSALRDEIIKELDSPDRMLPIADIARVLGIDPDNPTKRLSLSKAFPGNIYMLSQIYKEGDESKINAVTSMLMALTEEYRKKAHEELIGKHKEPKKSAA